MYSHLHRSLFAKASMSRHECSYIQKTRWARSCPIVFELYIKSYHLLTSPCPRGHPFPASHIHSPGLAFYTLCSCEKRGLRLLLGGDGDRVAARDSVGLNRRLVVALHRRLLHGSDSGVRAGHEKSRTRSGRAVRTRDSTSSRSGLSIPSRARGSA